MIRHLSIFLGVPLKQQMPHITLPLALENIYILSAEDAKASEDEQEKLPPKDVKNYYQETSTMGGRHKLLPRDGNYALHKAKEF